MDRGAEEDSLVGLCQEDSEGNLPASVEDGLGNRGDTGFLKIRHREESDIRQYLVKLIKYIKHI